jgi:hypothetical protein
MDFRPQPWDFSPAATDFFAPGADFINATADFTATTDWFVVSAEEFVAGPQDFDAAHGHQSGAAARIRPARTAYVWTAVEFVSRGVLPIWRGTLNKEGRAVPHRDLPRARAYRECSRGHQAPSPRRRPFARPLPTVARLKHLLPRTRLSLPRTDRRVARLGTCFASKGRYHTPVHLRLPAKRRAGSRHECRPERVRPSGARTRRGETRVRRRLAGRFRAPPRPSSHASRSAQYGTRAHHPAHGRGRR